ncbi:DUF3237 family protein [Loktanella agnita]|uniref:DUF3237 family protein n=1 Tax=Loktanella agnita TaxID=287097 RepID=UPI003986D8B8
MANAARRSSRSKDQRIKECDGTVLAGGANRQVLRPDGIKELDALYEMQTKDGTI